MLAGSVPFVPAGKGKTRAGHAGNCGGVITFTRSVYGVVAEVAVVAVDHDLHRAVLVARERDLRHLDPVAAGDGPRLAMVLFGIGASCKPFGLRVVGRRVQRVAVVRQRAVRDRRVRNRAVRDRAREQRLRAGLGQEDVEVGARRRPHEDLDLRAGNHPGRRKAAPVEVAARRDVTDRERVRLDRRRGRGIAVRLVRLRDRHRRLPGRGARRGTDDQPDDRGLLAEPEAGERPGSRGGRSGCRRRRSRVACGRHRPGRARRRPAPDRRRPSRRRRRPRARSCRP